ncbi:MAG: isoprenylcysteine carboxylmethyltransferase family protein [Terracidiphilus sp.]|jgi:protein-S-isoprenylcysteine O-methyltransferase Ste14
MATLRRSIVVSILFTVFGGPGLVLVYLPFAITRFRIPAGEPLWQTLIAAALIFAGLTPLLDSIRRFIYVGRGTLMPTVPTERLVASGLYRYVRNPMYIGVLIALTGEAVLFWNSGLVIEGAVGGLAIHFFVRLYEEPTLARRHPEDYPRYKRHVPRWLPRLTPWQDAGAGQGQ